jgi:hypothetical protein
VVDDGEHNLLKKETLWRVLVIFSKSVSNFIDASTKFLLVEHNESFLKILLTICAYPESTDKNIQLITIYIFN